MAGATRLLGQVALYMFMSATSLGAVKQTKNSSAANTSLSPKAEVHSRRLQADQLCFIQTSGMNFTLCGTATTFAGTNAYYLANTYRPTDDQAQRGVNMIRMFAFVNGYGGNSSGGVGVADYTPNPFQPGIGVFNEAAMKRLDLIISEANKHQILLIMVLSNYFPSMGGASWYVQQVMGSGQPIEMFYSDPNVRLAFKNYIINLLQRTNTITGLQYRNDPTIAAWDIMNEPQTTPFFEQNKGMQPGQLIANWSSDIAAYIKSNDPNHLVCMGEVAPPFQQYAYWGINYAANIQSPDIDFGSLHLYPEGWGIPYTAFSQPPLLAAQIDPFFDQAYNACKAAGKPVMLQEYGATPSYANRDVVLGALHAAANARGLSTLVWQLTATPNAPGDSFNFGFGDPGTDAMKQQFTFVFTRAKR